VANKADKFDNAAGASNVVKIAKTSEKAGDAYQFNMIENPGPLSNIKGNPAQNFYGGRYNIEVLSDDAIFYRAGESSKPLGQWFTQTPPTSVANVRIDTAVKPQWLDKTGVLTGTSNIDTIFAIKIPKGTTSYTGPVGYQGGIYLGGYDKMQIFIESPWKLNGVEVINSKPLK